MTERYNFNGMSNRLEVLTSIKENIQDGDTETAKPVADALDHHQIMQKGIVR